MPACSTPLKFMLVALPLADIGGRGVNAIAGSLRPLGAKRHPTATDGFGHLFWFKHFTFIEGVSLLLGPPYHLPSLPLLARVAPPPLGGAKRQFLVLRGPHRCPDWYSEGMSSLCAERLLCPPSWVRRLGLSPGGGCSSACPHLHSQFSKEGKGFSSPLGWELPGGCWPREGLGCPQQVTNLRRRVASPHSCLQCLPLQDSQTQPLTFLTL